MYACAVRLAGVCSMYACICLSGSEDFSRKDVIFNVKKNISYLHCDSRKSRLTQEKQVRASIRCTATLPHGERTKRTSQTRTRQYIQNHKTWKTGSRNSSPTDRNDGEEFTYCIVSWVIWTPMLTYKRIQKHTMRKRNNSTRILYTQAYRTVLAERPAWRARCRQSESRSSLLMDAHNNCIIPSEQP